MSATQGATVKFTATWSPIVYYTSIDDDGVYYDDWLILSTPAARTGYTFLGWSIIGMDSCTHYYGTSTTSYETTTLDTITTTATHYKNLTSVNGDYIEFNEMWAANTYTVEFYKDGTKIDTKTATYATAFAAPSSSVLVKTGYTHIGYSITGAQNIDHYYGSTSSGCINKFTSEDSVANYAYYKNMTATQGATVKMTATYSVHSYTITYNYSSGTQGTYNPAGADYDQVVNVSLPTRTGYTFSGWTISGCDTNTHYYGTTNSVTSTSSAASFNSGASAVYFKNLTATDGGDVTFTANWTVNKYKVEFYSDSTLVGTVDNVEYGKAFARPTITKTGYTLLSFNITGADDIIHFHGTTSSGCTTQFTSETSVVNRAYYKNLSKTNGATVTMTAVWTVNSYDIEYDYSSGTKGTYNPIAADYDEVIQISNPTRLGYTFSGWTITGMDSTTHNYGTANTVSTSSTNTSLSSITATYFKNLTAVDGDTVYFTAVWAANTYSVEFYDGTTKKGTVPATYDTAFAATNMTKTGYTLTGFTITGAQDVDHYYGSTSSGCTNKFTSETSVDDYAYYKNLSATKNATVKMTAVYTVHTYTVSYALNSGTTGGSQPTSATYDQVFNVTNPTRTGYTFAGWSITGMDSTTHNYGTTNAVSSSSTNTSLSSIKATYFKNLTAVNSGTVYFSATWTANDYDIEINLDGGDWGRYNYKHDGTQLYYYYYGSYSGRYSVSNSS